jgi:hypothetical protein
VVEVDKNVVEVPARLRQDKTQVVKEAQRNPTHDTAQEQERQEMERESVTIR